MIQDFEADLSLLCDLIKSNEPFAFMRFADGESAIMKGQVVYGIDGWTSPNYLGILGQDLLTAIANDNPRVYYGISCDCCNSLDKEFLWNLIKNKKENVTFSNIFVNSNYRKAIDFLASIKEPINLIANYNINLLNFPLSIKDFVPIPDNCVSFYENFKNYFLKNFDRFKHCTNELFIISAGPLSEVIIDYLWKINPTNRYIDVGSTIGEWVHGKPIREFVFSNSPFNQRQCHMSLKDKN